MRVRVANDETPLQEPNGDRRPQHLADIRAHVVAVAPVLEHHVMMTADRVLASDAHVQFVVRRRPGCGVECADSVEDRTSIEHDSRRPDVVRTKQSKKLIAGRMGLRRRGLGSAISTDEANVSRDEGPIGVIAEDCDPLRKRIGQQPIVSVEEQNELALRRAKAAVTRRRRAFVRLPQVLYGGIALRDACRVISRSIVDDDHLDGVDTSAVEHCLSLLRESGPGYSRG